MTLGEWFEKNARALMAGKTPLEFARAAARAAYQLGYEDGRNRRDNKNEEER